MKFATLMMVAAVAATTATTPAATTCPKATEADKLYTKACNVNATTKKACEDTLATEK
jgi:hypothetical protein